LTWGSTAQAIISLQAIAASAFAANKLVLSSLALHWLFADQAAIFRALSDRSPTLAFKNECTGASAGTDARQI
jgi:hypothetical protein